MTGDYRDLQWMFRACNERQQAVLGAIAMNQDGGHHPATLKTLVKRGLIERYTETRPSQFGMMHVYRHRMPLAIHIAWCEFCSKELAHLPDQPEA